jgi:DinB family protein
MWTSALCSYDAGLAANAETDHHVERKRKMTTHDPRYPVGPFESAGRMLTGGERAKLIDAIEAHPANMRAAVDGLTVAQLDTPYRDGGWTVRQVVHHVVDSHVNSYVRFKLAVTEDNPTIGTYDQTVWAELADAKVGAVEASLAILDALHARWVAFLRALTPEHFRRSVRHPEVGDITVDVLLEIYGWHCPHHEGHITALRSRMGW